MFCDYIKIIYYIYFFYFTKISKIAPEGTRFRRYTDVNPDRKRNRDRTGTRNCRECSCIYRECTLSASGSTRRFPRCDSSSGSWFDPAPIRTEFHAHLRSRAKDSLCYIRVATSFELFIHSRVLSLGHFSQRLPHAAPIEQQHSIFVCGCTMGFRHWPAS